MKKAINKAVVTILKKNTFLRERAVSTDLMIKKMQYKKFYKKYDVDDKLCVFEAFNGRKYCDSPKALYLEMLNDKKYKDYKFVWFNSKERAALNAAIGKSTDDDDPEKNDNKNDKTGKGNPEA